MTEITINGSTYQVSSYRVITTVAGRFELIKYEVSISGLTYTETLKRRV